MEELKRIISSLSVLLVVIFCAFTLMISGCGGGGGSDTQTLGLTDPSTEGGEGADNPYAGSSQILGQVSLSSLISTDQGAIDESSGSNLSRRRGRVSRYIVNPDTEAVRLYVIGEDGELEDTNIDCTCQADPADPNNGIVYTCPEVKDGINYIVKYIKLIKDPNSSINKVLEMKASAYVPSGETEWEVNVTRYTSAIAEFLTTAILDAIIGTEVTQETVNKIVDAVKIASETLVNTGFISVDYSMITETESDSLAEVLGEDIENDRLANTSGAILSDDSVSTHLNAVKTEIKSEKFDLEEIDTDTEKAELIERVFKEMMDDDEGMPDFMMDFFTDKYKEDVTKTVGQTIEAVSNGLHIDYWNCPDNFSVTKSGAVDAFKQELTKIYNIIETKENDPNSLLEDDLKKLAEIPPVILGLFPVSEKETWKNIDLNTTLNIPRSIAFTIFVVKVYVSDAYEAAGIEGDIATDIADDGKVVIEERKDPFNFDPMSPGSILDLLGFRDVMENYSGIDIFDLWVHPCMYWDDIAQKDKDMLISGVCWGDVLAMMNPNSNIDYSKFTVTLTYPKRGGGTGIIELKREADLFEPYYEPDMEPPPANDPWNNRWVLDPWMEAKADNPDYDLQETMEPDSNRIVSEFTTGYYTVTVKSPNGTITEKDFYKLVITGMKDIYPILTSPAQMPIWPGHDATEAEWEEFRAAEAKYSTTNFNASTKDPDSGEDAANITIEWNAPKLDTNVTVLPEGVKMGYELDIGRSWEDEYGCWQWDHIYATWEDHKLLFGTSFTLPVLVPKQQQDERPYEVHLRVVFIDQVTGEHLGQGGTAHAEFTVTDPLVLTDTFIITGNVTIEDMIGNSLTLNDVKNLKVALFRETSDDNDDILGNIDWTWTRTTLRAGALTEDPATGIISYTLEPEIGDFIDPNYGCEGWVGIDIFQDQDGDDKIDTNPSEPSWGPSGDSDYNVRFDTWGGILRVQTDTYNESEDYWSHQETIITGPDPNGVLEEVNGPNYRVGIWFNCEPDPNDYEFDPNYPIYDPNNYEPSPRHWFSLMT